tara:strand:+ start:244 stop:981 length:738 start_codon:yes stop_codon:yes gene_type:complete
MTIPFIKINDINVRNLNVPHIHTFSYDLPTPVAPGHPRVTEYIGRPIVDIPGCVEAHPDDRNAQNLPEDDSAKVQTFCDGEVPSYNAMDYTPEQLIIQREVPPPVVNPPPEVDPPEVPPTGDLGTETECPGPNNLRVGDLTQAGDEKVVGHELQGTVCVTLYEPTTAAEKFLPSVNQSTTTVAIAVLATAGAAATPLLLRVIKPVIKKLTTFIQKKLGKKVSKPSRQDIQTDKYREKKGLPPIKR